MPAERRASILSSLRWNDIPRFKCHGRIQPKFTKYPTSLYYYVLRSLHFTIANAKKRFYAAKMECLPSPSSPCRALELELLRPITEHALRNLGNPRRTDQRNELFIPRLFKQTRHSTLLCPRFRGGRPDKMPLSLSLSLSMHCNRDRHAPHPFRDCVLWIIHPSSVGKTRDLNYLLSIHNHTV